jgi:hypothetical protein
MFEVTGGERLLNEKLKNLCCSPGNMRVMKIKDDETGEACSMYVGKEMCIEAFVKET